MISEESAHEKVLIFTKPKNVEKLGNIVASKVGDDPALRFVQTMTNLNTVIRQLRNIYNISTEEEKESVFYKEAEQFAKAAWHTLNTVIYVAQLTSRGEGVSVLVSQARMFIRNALACMTAWIRKYRNQRDYFHESARAQKKATTPM